MHWDDYSNELVPDAEAKLLSMLGASVGNCGIISDQNIDDLKSIINRTKWKFAWTYARTYPHEYTTKNQCSLDDHSRIIDCIERFGIIERFGDSRRKYLYFHLNFLSIIPCII
jgi:hypothetical protein